ncbi:aspartic proteinase nepenthesin-1-like [Mercurialis annua]|uniref:aspartic proteinase nepenthesin-1-like n=1 Tax=Mercurialis annua TaxID=3986 RepID=UPI00215E48D6|nr:aspartic proteinase nepenthesin-1-like [Mercurialis annua]
MYHIGKLMNDSESLLLARIRLTKQRYKNFWMPEPIEVNMSLAVYPTGEYIVDMKVGSQIVPLLLDTGSPLIWWQCAPCEDCFKQINYPVYNQSLSEDYDQHFCPSINCIEKSGRGIRNQCINHMCHYKIQYGDGSTSEGVYAYETISDVRGMLEKQIIFGCGVINKGAFYGYYAGILGFQNDPLSFPNQIQADKFSFCFVPSQPKFDRKFQKMPDSSTLYLYDFPYLNEDTTFIVELTHSGQHYVEFMGIKIDDVMIPIDAAFWKRDELGKYGVMVDSGTTLTRFPPMVYNKVRNSFLKGVKGKMKAFKIESFDTCFYSPGSTPGDYIPKVSLCFADEDRELQLAPEHIMTSIGLIKDTYCFAFLEMESELTILGNHQLQHTRLSFNMWDDVVSFTPDDC